MLEKYVQLITKVHDQILFCIFFLCKCPKYSSHFLIKEIKHQKHLH